MPAEQIGNFTDYEATKGELDHTRDCTELCAGGDTIGKDKWKYLEISCEFLYFLRFIFVICLDGIH